MNDGIIIDATPHPCPYLSEETAVLPLRYYRSNVSPVELDALLASSDRRVGRLLYRPSCPDCAACEGIRIPVQEFRRSKSERRVINRNRDLEVSIGPAIVDEGRLALFNRHKLERGLAKEPTTAEHYRNWLVLSCARTIEVRYHLEGRLVGLSILDVGATSASSVYFYFDPDLPRRSLGTLSVLAEVEWLRQQGKQFYYLGLYIEKSPHMNYKARFRPHERLVDGEWVRFE